jgi:transcriptional regulator with XRE-family HTH domain
MFIESFGSLPKGFQRTSFASCSHASSNEDPLPAFMSTMDYGKAIRIVRALADIPQRELARRLDVDPSLISLIEAGKRKPSREFLERFATILGVPFHLLILLASGPGDSKDVSPETLEKLAMELATLLFTKGDHEERIVQDKTPEHCA